MMKNNKFWLFLILMVILSLGSQLQAQVNRILTLAPTAEEASLGNQSLAFHNPARNYFETDTLFDLSFTRVNWLTNITDDMGYNYVGGAYKHFTFSLLYFDYGEQNVADESGVISGQFNPNSVVAYVGWGTELQHKRKKLENIAIGFGGVRPCISALGGDQFSLPKQEKQLTSFFSFFYIVFLIHELIFTLYIII